jgi:hypothetical protein
MKIFTQINDTHLHLKYDFSGEYALEIWFLSLSEIYYGKTISRQIGTILKSHIAEEELNKNLNDLALKVHKIQKGGF